MKTQFAKKSESERKWYVVDATDKVLGRMATKIAMKLMGKDKPSYTPNADTGDFVVIVNAEKVRLTGKKVTDKKYYWHTGYPGGLKESNLRLIVMRYHEEMSCKEISEATNRSIQTVYKSLARIYTALKSCIDETIVVWNSDLQ